MASFGWFAPRECWRVQYTVHSGAAKVRRARYVSAKTEARLLANQLGQLEEATRRQYATREEVERWLAKEWLTDEEAAQAFAGFADVIAHRRRETARTELTDYTPLLRAYEEYSLRTGKGGEDRANLKTHRNNLSMAGQVVAWLQARVPHLVDLTSAEVRTRLDELRREGYTDWTVSNYLTKLRLLLDQAVALRVVEQNVAREVTVGQPRTAHERRILSEEEATRLLEASLGYRQQMNGCLPTVVRLGLYAGLRNQEMCWLTWEAIDWKHRIISVRETTCAATSRTWVPKDFEVRRLDVKPACLDYLKEERIRQTRASLSSPFVIPGGDVKRRRYHEQPLSENVPQKCFSRMIAAEGLDPAITVYSLRHTYATMALRAGVDLRTLQKRMGHSHIKTTMEYLHYIEPEQHPMDRLPY